MMFRLRAPMATDVDWICEACQDIDIQRWTLVPRPYLLEHAQWFVGSDNGELLSLVIIDGETELPVGVIGIHALDPLSGEAPVGYWIAPWGRGKRAATHALGLIISYAQEFSELKTLIAYIAEGNIGSRKTAQAAGFLEVGVEVARCHDGLEPTNGIVYRLRVSNAR